MGRPKKINLIDTDDNIKPITFKLEDAKIQEINNRIKKLQEQKKVIAKKKVDREKKEREQVLVKIANTSLELFELNSSDLSKFQDFIDIVSQDSAFLKSIADTNATLKERYDNILGNSSKNSLANDLNKNSDDDLNESSNNTSDKNLTDTSDKNLSKDWHDSVSSSPLNATSTRLEPTDD